jgi:hypothetical protein
MAPKQHERRNDLSVRERCQVVGIALGFLVVLGFLAWLAIDYAAPATLVAAIPEAFRIGKIRRGLSLCVTLVFYVVGLPVGLVLSVIAIIQGALGRRTRLTRWILREMKQKEDTRQEGTPTWLEPEVELSPAEKVLQSKLRPAVGWGIFLGVLVIAVAVLVWAATRE